MSETHRSLVGEILDALSTALRPFLSDALQSRISTNDWTELLELKDEADGREVRKVNESDLVAQIRILTTRLPEVGYLLELDRRQSRYLGEIRDYRNDWAHGQTFEIDDVRRLGDTVNRLLMSFGLEHSAGAVLELLNTVVAPTNVNLEISSRHVEEASLISHPPSDGQQRFDEPSQQNPTSDSAEVSPPSAATLSISAEHESQVNFALVNWIAMAAPTNGHESGVGLISSVTIHNDAGQTGTATLTTQLMGSQGPLSDASERILELSPGEIRLTDTGLLPDPARFFDVTAPEAGRINFTLTQAQTTLASLSSPVTVEPAQSWAMNRQRISLSGELLAAWVQPQDPALTPVISKAQDILQARTGDSALNAHQSDPSRDEAIIQAVFEAVQDQGIRYSNPPASWFNSQIIRSPHQVLTDRIGTCLDTSILLASVLEEIGMHPQICLVDGHAFVTVSASENAVSNSGDDFSEARQLVAASVLRVLESTAVTLERKADLSTASRSTKENYLGPSSDPANFKYLTDVRVARRAGIFPLPVRRVSNDGDVQIIAYEPAKLDISSAWRDSKSKASVPVRQPDGRILPSRVVQWKNQLLDLSLRNRLLNFSSDRHRLSLGVTAKNVDLFEDLLNNGRSIELLPADDISASDHELHVTGMQLPEDRRDDLMLEKSQVYVADSSTTYARRLRKMATDARTELQQSGTNNLYIALGTLVWTARDSKGSKTLRSPLILIPVELSSAGKNSTYRITMDPAGESTPNYCLLERLWQDHQLKLPGLENLVADQFGMDVEQAFSSITATLNEKQLDFYVERTVDLATLQFAKFRLWKDLDENWEQFAKNSLVDHLIQHPTEIFEDSAASSASPHVENLDDLANSLPIAADGSQLDAISLSRQGRTFVIEGPPGTGKSQTITNLLAAAMADNKRVLFVAEKSAALDVVSTRLKSVGLGPFVLDLHDKSASVASVRGQILKSLDHTVRGDDVGLRVLKQDLEMLQRKLTRYSRQLHENNPVGYSAYSARSFELAMDDAISPVDVTEEFAATKSEETVDNIRRALLEVPELAEHVDRVPHHPWGFINESVPADLSSVLDAADRYTSARDQLLSVDQPAGVREYLDTDPSPESIEELVKLASAPRSLSFLEAALTPEWNASIEQALTDSEALQAAEALFGRTLTEQARKDDLLKLADDAEAAASSGFLGIGRRKKLQSIADSITGGWRGTDDALYGLAETLRTAAESHAAASEIEISVRSSTGIDLPTNWSAFSEDSLAQLRQQHADLSSMARRWDTLRSGIPVEAQTFIDALVTGETSTSIRELTDYGKALRGLLHDAGVTESAWHEWQSGMPLYRRWVTTDVPRAQGYLSTDQLTSWATFVSSLETLREEGLETARAHLLDGTADADLAVQSFDKGLARAALSERLITTGLRRFPAKTHERDIKQFEAKMSLVRQNMQWKIPQTLLVRRHEYERAHPAGLGRVRREIAKKRGGLSVRQLMETHGQHIQALMPCILVSPDSVARFFPPQADMFDLVVFDEASQITVADAVGAMGRGTAVVVVGDSKQMPPTSFGAGSWAVADDASDTDTELDLEVVTDEESILSECIQARVPRRWLSWHYRSKDESLIAFSNQMYYESKLASFPAPRFGTTGPEHDGFGVSWVKVDGRFLRDTSEGSRKLLRTNPVEAQAIVDEISSRFRSNSGPHSIGVVTFNKQQRDLIEDLIRAHDDDRMARSLDSEEEGLFVKNLENVQGDERDVILFSTGFSVNDKGVLPLNFGPLNNPGGERRLNVAVTRARRQVIVFSSFEPEQLRADETGSLGIKHLRAYLEMAKYGPETLPVGERSLDRTDRHRDHIADALRAEGLSVSTDVGLSDFKVDISLADPQDPDSPLVAILLDGEEWSQRLTVGDRDGLPGQVLKGSLRWPGVARIWMPEWLQDQEAVKERIMFSYRSAVAARDKAKTQQGTRKADQRVTAKASLPSTVREVPSISDEIDELSRTDLLTGMDTDQVDVEEAPAPIFHASVAPASPSTPPSRQTDLLQVRAETIRADNAPSGPRHVNQDMRTYDPAAFDPLTFEPDPVLQAHVPSGGSVEDLDRMWDADVEAMVKAKIAAVVAAEWPIHEDRLARVVNGSFGLKKSRASRLDAVQNHIDEDLYVTDGDGFVWPASIDQDSWFEYRTYGEPEHVTITDACPLEVANALLHILLKTGPLEADALFERSKARLGYARRGKNVNDLLDRAVELGLHTGRLREDAGGRISAGMVL
ncbi:DUF4011 domain-containing protein [Micrococcus sp. IITD107]|uniref:DUF4011 domain-containing protein n=1 Tax=Micrococcus sp. IITD107 TaxID=3342790 RepID=UPI0035B8E73E